MNWYKKASQDLTEFNVWLGNEMARLTKNYELPLIHLSILEGVKKGPEDMIPLLVDWYLRTNPNLSKTTFTDAIIQARDYIKSQK